MAGIARRSLAFAGLSIVPGMSGVPHGASTLPLFGSLFRRPIFARLPKVAAIEEPAADSTLARWPLVSRVLFRFAFAYLFLYNYTYFVPYNGMEALTERAAHWVFGHAVPSTPNGSGDTAYMWAEALDNLLVALAVTLIWSVCDRKRTQYARLYEWLRSGVRFSLFLVMLSYGADKLIPNQFGSVTAARLTERIGDLSPMGMLWTFMAASKPYTMFGGLMEVAGGLLLTTRRTALLGALVCIPVLTNVVMMNFCYDVPVKLISSHLLAMAIFLTFPDICRLWNVFVINKAAPPAVLAPHFRKRWMNILLLALRTYFVFNTTQQEFANKLVEQSYGTMYGSAPLDGLWHVDVFEKERDSGGKAVAPVTVPNAERWQSIVVGGGYVRVNSASDLHHGYAVDNNGSTRTLILRDKDSHAVTFRFRYARPPDQTLTLDQTVDGVHTHIGLHHVDEKSFLLLNRGFHWINERPFNR